jgi:hypothetical protein
LSPQLVSERAANAYELRNRTAGFNGLFFDKSLTGGYEGYPPPTRRGYRTVARQRSN